MFAALFALAVTGFVSAADPSACHLDVSLVNQDPVHVVPGEYVKVVFQLSGVENPNCKDVSFNLLPEYPFSVDPGVETQRVIPAGTFTQSYNSQATIPFTLRVDKDALDNDYRIKVQFGTTAGGSSALVEKEFNISVEDVTSNFDVFVQDYDEATKTLTFDIVNIGKNDVDALSVKIPKQSTIEVKGANQAIVGSLDSGQDTTFSYEATPEDGNINLEISYNDQNGDRRTVTKSVNYDSSYFTGRVQTESSSSWRWILVLVVIIAIGVWYYLRRRKKNKEKEKRKFS